MIEWRSFVVDERPQCMFGVDLSSQNSRFLTGLDTSYFKYGVDIHMPNLLGPEKHRAALAIRSTYAHALETFFALLMAAVQAPHCPLGWILKYKTPDLASIVTKVNDGRPIRSRLQFQESWHGIADAIHVFELDDHEEDRRVRRFFGDVWARFARDFLNPIASDEYNSIKHGLRSTACESTTRIGPVESYSEFGTHYFRPERVGERAIDFEVQEVARSWSPTSLAIRTEILCLSIGNVLCFLRGELGTPSELLEYRWPIPDDRLATAWASAAPIHSTVYRPGVQVSTEHLRASSQILSDYALMPAASGSIHGA